MLVLVSEERELAVDRRQGNPVRCHTVITLCSIFAMDDNPVCSAALGNLLIQLCV